MLEARRRVVQGHIFHWPGEICEASSMLRSFEHLRIGASLYLIIAENPSQPYVYSSLLFLVPSSCRERPEALNGHEHQSRVSRQYFLSPHTCISLSIDDTFPLLLNLHRGKLHLCTLFGKSSLSGTSGLNNAGVKQPAHDLPQGASSYARLDQLCYCSFA